MALVRCQFAPAVAVQQVVDRGQGHLASQGRFQLSLDLRDHQNAPAARTFQKRHQHLGFAFNAQILSASPTRALTLSVPHGLPGQKAVTQSAGPYHRAAYDLGGLFQTQSVRQRQHHRLRLAQFVNRLGPQDHLLRHLQYFGPTYRSGHGYLHKVVEKPILLH